MVRWSGCTVSKPPVFAALAVVLCLAGPSLAEESGGEEPPSGEEGEGPRLETGSPGGGSDYQLSGPEELSTPDELLGGGGVPDEEQEEIEEEEEEEEPAGEEPVDEDPSVSLELDLDAPEATGELPPVHPVEPEEPLRLRWLLVPPYYQGFRGEEGVRLFFPFFFQRWSIEGHRELMVVPFYYQSRGPEAESAVDVAFPLVY